jgi:hypothetical protein
MGTLRGESILPTAAYATTLLSPGAERLLGGSVPNIGAAHSYACLQAAERGDMPRDVELATFSWLAGQYSIAVTPEFVEQFDQARLRRLDLQVALESERTLDPLAAARARNARRLRERIVRVEQQIASMEPGSPGIDRWRGALAGLQTEDLSGRFPVSDETTSESYRGGRFGGDLLACLILDGRSPIEAVRMTCYRYGAALASPAGDTLLAEAAPTNALKAHALGMHVLERAGESAIDEDLEISLLNWLAARLGVPVTPEVLESRKRFVARRKAPD